MRSTYLITSCISLFLLVWQHSVTAQAFAPIGAEWRQMFNLTGLSGDEFRRISVAKDTIVNGQECRKLEVFEEWADTEADSLLHVEFTFSRNDSVFFWQRDTFLLTYNYAAVPGDTITIPIYDVDTLTQFRVVLDSIVPTPVGLNSTILDRYHTTHIDGPFNYPGGYYETIGNARGLRSWIYLGGIIVGSPIARLRCYSDAFIEIPLQTNGCSFPSTTQNLIESAALRLSPNPAQDFLLLEYAPRLRGGFLRCLDQSGRELFTTQLPEVEESFKLPLLKLEPGLYYLSLYHENQVGTWPFIKM